MAFQQGKAYLTDGSLHTSRLAEVKMNRKKRCGMGKKCAPVCEAIILFHVILAVIGLFLIPTVFYFKPLRPEVVSNAGIWSA